MKIDSPHRASIPSQACTPGTLSDARKKEIVNQLVEEDQKIAAASQHPLHPMHAEVIGQIQGDIRVIDYTKLVCAINWNEILGAHANEIRILDAACGSGRFRRTLEVLLKAANDTRKVIYSLLDQSNIIEIAAQGMQTVNTDKEPSSGDVKGRFVLGKTYQIPFHQLRLPDEEKQDLVICTHGLYLTPAEDLPSIISTFIDAVKPGGKVVLAMPRRADGSAYIHLQDRLDNTVLTAAEDVESAIQTLKFTKQETAPKDVHAQLYDVETVAYDEVIQANDYRSLYLHIVSESIANCGANRIDENQLTDAQCKEELAKLWAHSRMADYLSTCYDRERCCYRFKEVVDVFVIHVPEGERRLMTEIYV